MALRKHEEGPVAGKSRPVEACELSEQPLCPVSRNRLPEPLSHDDAHARLRGLGRDGCDGEQWGVMPAPLPLHALDVGAVSHEEEPIASPSRPTPGEIHTVSRCRPLARRRANTLRPALVLMRLRNPWSRLRFKFDGCFDVNDMDSSSATLQRIFHYMDRARCCQSHRALEHLSSRSDHQHNGRLPFPRPQP